MYPPFLINWSISKIKEDKVVNPPHTPVARRRRASLERSGISTDNPVTIPIRKQPARLDTSVPQGIV